jgi:hypothetical protein
MQIKAENEPEERRRQNWEAEKREEEYYSPPEANAKAQPGG